MECGFYSVTQDKFVCWRNHTTYENYLDLYWDCENCEDNPNNNFITIEEVD